MGGGGGGAIPTPATTASNHHSPPPRFQTVSPFSSNLYTESSDFVDESERKSRGSLSKTIFGPVPSQTEVQNAISDLRRVMDGFCTRNSEKNGVGKIMEQFPYDSSRTLMRSLGEKRLLDAYHLLQTDPSVQRLVASISSDTEVWDAILKNNAVQDLQGVLPQYSGTEEKAKIYDQELDSTTLIIKWIFALMRSKFMELIEKLEVFVIGALQSMSKKGNSTSEVDDLLEEKVRSSLLLSVVVLLVVVVTRSMET